MADAPGPVTLTSPEVTEAYARGDVHLLAQWEREGTLVVDYEGPGGDSAQRVMAIARQAERDLGLAPAPAPAPRAAARAPSSRDPFDPRPRSTRTAPQEPATESGDEVWSIFHPAYVTARERGDYDTMAAMARDPRFVHFSRGRNEGATVEDMQAVRRLQEGTGPATPRPAPPTEGQRVADLEAEVRRLTNLAAAQQRRETTRARRETWH